MTKYITSRMWSTFVVLVLVSVAVFSMVYLLPGDVLTAFLGQGFMGTAEDIERIKEGLGLNDPIYVQYWRFIAGAVRGDLGKSLAYGIPVMQLIREEIPATVELTIAGMLVAILMGVVLGVVAAVRQNQWADTLSMFFALIGVSMPSFWLGLMLIFYFSLHLGWFPATGAAGLSTLVLPAFALGIRSAATVARLTRSSLLEVLRQDYVMTARAKGLAGRAVVYKHALKNALIPVVTMLGLQVGGLLGGAVITETVFSRPGLGRLAVAAINYKDFPLVQGSVLFAATMFVLVNFAVDITYGFLDPRVRYQ